MKAAKVQLTAEGKHATQFLCGKIVKRVWRHRRGEVVIDFTDRTRLFVDHTEAGLELSVTGFEDED